MHAHGTCAHNWICVPSAHAHTIAYACPLRTPTQLHRRAQCACAQIKYACLLRMHCTHSCKDVSHYACAYVCIWCSKCGHALLHLRMVYLPNISFPVRGCTTKYLHIEYRAVSGVFRTIHPPPLSTQRVCPPPAPKAGGTHSPGGEEVEGQYFGRRQTLDWPLTA
jgi:hypothetical protein